MTILPGLTSTERDRIPAFLSDLRDSEVRAIALFPTVLSADERRDLYGELESIPDLIIPHVHLRTDCEESELDYLVDRFSTEFFNIHPQASTHPFGEVPRRHAAIVFVENVQVAPDDEELERLGGICPDYSHLDSARRMGMDAYVQAVGRQLGRYPIGCCHVSAIRPGVPNEWNGGPDHHEYRDLSDFDYMARYAGVLPERWVSLELENSLGEQLRAASYLDEMLSSRSAGVGLDLDLEPEHMNQL